jgi:hypothetical protein
MSVSIGGDDSGQPTDGSLWGCSCGGSARERVVGATCSGVIRMAEVPRGRLEQGRFLNRLRFAEVNAERSREIFNDWTNIFLFFCVDYICIAFHNIFSCVIRPKRVPQRQQYSTTMWYAVRRPRLASRYRVFLRSQLHLRKTHL